jgi:hypothetical protein
MTFGGFSLSCRQKPVNFQLPYDFFYFHFNRLKRSVQSFTKIVAPFSKEGTQNAHNGYEIVVRGWANVSKKCSNCEGLAFGGISD